jgi:distribution and morphology protein 34
MTLRLSALNLRAILILVISKSKGITLVFKNDPLQNVDVSSTFDSIEVIRGYLQQEIEGQLKELFREDLPGIIHRLSQKWFGGAGMSGKVEMPYRHESVRIDPDDPYTPGPREVPQDLDEQHEDYFSRRETQHALNNRQSTLDPEDMLGPDDSISVSPSRRHRSSGARRRPVLGPVAESPTSYTTFPEIENYDPTYGLRPEGLPTHSGYEAFGRLWGNSREDHKKGLGSLMGLAEEITFSEADEIDPDDLIHSFDEDNESFIDSDDEANSIDAVDASPSLRARLSSRNPQHRTRSISTPFDSGRDIHDRTGVTTAGNGLVGRPRIFHVQSQIRAPSEAGGSSSFMQSPSNTVRANTAGSFTALTSSVRSSAGGSSVGLGMARSLLNESQAPGSKRMWTNRPLPPQFRVPMQQIDPTSSSSVALNTRPISSRRHSRADSVPLGHPPHPLSRLHNMIAESDGEESSPYQTVAAPRTINSTRPRPMSVQGYPLYRNTTPPRNRRPSGNYPSGSPPSINLFGAAGATRLHGITLPLNDSVSQLASLSHSNHTMSPYARSHEHVAVRSFPHLSRANSLVAINHGQNSAGPASGNGSLLHMNVAAPLDPNKLKARRKRMYRFSEQNPQSSSEPQCSANEEAAATSRRPLIRSDKSYGFPSAPQ